MGLAHSPGIVTNGLILCLDAANRKSYIGAAPPPIITGKDWTTGSGGFTGFSQNGDTVENERILTTDPWGNSSVIWETRPTGTSDADGGWNSSYFSIDRTKLYRFSVWVKRTSSTSGGTFYLGTGAGGQEVMRTDNGAEQGNPYWECEGTGALTQNVWYLVCGHIYPYNTTYTGRHPETGMFTIANGPSRVRDVNGCNIGNDLKWAPGSTSALHRTYHYYCGDNTTRLQFAFPRVDICDGTEPSIAELLNNGDSVWKDLSGNNNNFAINCKAHNSTNKYFDFNGSYGMAKNPTDISLSGDVTYVCLTRPKNSTAEWRTLTRSYSSDHHIIIQAGGWEIGIYDNDSAGFLSTGYSQQSLPGYASNNFNFMAWRWTNADNPTHALTVNGSQVGTITNSNARYNRGFGSLGGYHDGNTNPYSGSQWWGDIAYFAVYNRRLTDQELVQCYSAIRGRYNI